MIWKFTVWEVAYSLIAHFILGLSVGWLVYFLTSTIFSRGGIQAYFRDDPTIRRCLFWLVVSLSIVVHVLEDYIVRKF